MRFALLGTDPEALKLAAAVVASRDSLEAVFAPGTLDAGQREMIRGALVFDNWQALLATENIDAVIVARHADPEEQAERLRKLVAEGLPLLVVQPACAAIVGYELSMIQSDGQSTIVGYVPGEFHSAIARLNALALASLPSKTSADIENETEETVSPPGSPELGVLEQITIDRQLPRRDAATVQAQIARDAALAFRIIGRLNKVSAMVPPGVAEPLSAVSVNLSGKAGVLVRWNISPGSTARGVLTLVGSQGQAVLTMPEDPNLWELQLTSAGKTQQERLPPYRDAEAALQNFKRQVELKNSASAASNEAWLQSCRDIEIAETVHHSLRRNRTIELHDDSYTEADVFKGAMAIGGCGLLMAALLMVCIAVMVDALQLPFASSPVWQLWPFLLGGLLGIFMLMQLLQLIVPKKQGKQAMGMEPEPDSIE